jgi:hypothetical protein
MAGVVKRPPFHNPQQTLRRILPCRQFEAVLLGKKVSYRIPLVPNARRFRIGHKVRLYLTTGDQTLKSRASRTGLDR